MLWRAPSRRSRNPPALEHDLSQIAILFERVLADRLTQLLSGQVMFDFGGFTRFVGCRITVHFQDIVGVGQRLAYKLVGFQLISRVVF